MFVKYTQGLFDGKSMYFAKKIAEAAMSDGAKQSILYSGRDNSAM